MDFLPPGAPRYRVGQRIRRLIRAEQRYVRNLERNAEERRAEQEALKADQDQSNVDQASTMWSENRALNLTDFDYLFFHRERLSKPFRSLMEIISSKLNHISDDDKDGYFKKLERNIGWKQHITPIVLAPYKFGDKLARCGLWANARNSRRCHKTDLCSLCLWNDILKVLDQAYGSQTPTFNRAPAWWFVTCGFTTKATNTTYVAREYEPGDLKYVPVVDTYESYPVQLGFGSGDEAYDEYIGYDDARCMGMVVQEALDGVYQEKLVDGYRYKLEGAFAIIPGQPSRINLHGHAIANGREPNGEFLAEEISSFMAEGLKNNGHHLSRPYYADVKVLQIVSAEDLQRCMRYTEKIIPVDQIMHEALQKSEAVLPNGDWNPTYMDWLNTSLQRLLNEDVPNIFTSFNLDHHLITLRRRKTVGNMTFTDTDTCIASEPEWHAKLRRKKSREQRKKRREKLKKLKDEWTELNPGVPWRGLKTKRRAPSRSSPRRLQRSLQGPDQALGGLSLPHEAEY